MAEITCEVIYRELLVLEEKLSRVERIMTDNLNLLRQTNGELAEGRKKIDVARRRFGDGRLARGIDG